jgi:hypothetical protein
MAHLRRTCTDLACGAGATASRTRRRRAPPSSTAAAAAGSVPGTCRSHGCRSAPQRRRSPLWPSTETGQHHFSNVITHPIGSIGRCRQLQPQKRNPGILDTPHNHPSMHPAAPSAGTLLPFSAGPRPSTPSTYAPSRPYITRSAATCAGLRDKHHIRRGWPMGLGPGNTLGNRSRQIG